MLMQVGTLNYMSPEAILGGTNNIRGAPPMKVCHLSAPSALTGPHQLAMLSCWPLPLRVVSCYADVHQPISTVVVDVGIPAWTIQTLDNASRWERLS